ncbi:hypothetical protein [Gymnodinialimonas sp. 57CJ19]
MFRLSCAEMAKKCNGQGVGAAGEVVDFGRMPGQLAAMAVVAET